MKKYFLSALFLLSATCLFFSCSDDDDNNGEEQVVESFSVENFNELELLQNHLVVIDSTGAWQMRINGEPLDDADTTLLFMGVKDIEEAKQIFKRWFPDNADIITMGDNMTVNLRDEDRKAQGTVYFTAKTQGSTINSYPLIAEVSFNADIKYVSKLYFIAESSWPENEKPEYTVGDILPSGAMVISETKDGKIGLSIRFTEPYTPSGRSSYLHALVIEAVGVLQQDMELFKILFEDNGIEFNESDFYWTGGGYADGFWDVGHYAIRPKDGKIDWFTTTWKKPKKRRIEVI